MNIFKLQTNGNILWAALVLLSVVYMMMAAPAYAVGATGTIVTGGNAGYAWSSQTGWINFGVTNGNIQITDTAITGYAWSPNYGWINMAPSNSGVKVAADGTLSGYAWGASLGWINFTGVSITSVGKFIGEATGVVVGTTTFSCANCDVRTDYIPPSFRAVTESGGSSGGSVGGSIPRVAPVVTPAITFTPAPTFAPPEGDTTFPAEPVTPTIEDEDELLPEELFDIRLVIDRANVSSFQDLVARVTFESFGRVPTPVALTFTVFNEENKVIFTSKDEVTIETTGVFVKRFSDAGDLAPGNYTIRLHTLYNVDVEDDFEAAFTVGAVGGVCISFLSICLIWWIIGGCIVLALLLFYYIVWKRRNRNEEVTQKGIGAGKSYNQVY